jgi:hypothetical protein
MSQDDIFEQLRWLEADENPFHMQVLDCRPFSTGMISTTNDPYIAARFSHLRTSTGVEHRGQHPKHALVVPCESIYPFNGEFRDGPLFVAPKYQMQTGVRVLRADAGRSLNQPRQSSWMFSFTVSLIPAD